VDYCVNKVMEFLMESTTRHHHSNVLRALCMVSKVLWCGIPWNGHCISHQQSYYVHFRNFIQDVMAYSSCVPVLDILINHHTTT